MLQAQKRCLQFVGGDGLQKKIEHAHADCLPGIVEFVIAREDDDLGAGEQLFDLPCEGDAVAKRHFQIGDDKIGGELFDERQRLPSVFRFADDGKAECIPGKQLFHAGADEGFIVHQKDGQRCVWHRAFSFLSDQCR